MYDGNVHQGDLWIGTDVRGHRFAVRRDDVYGWRMLRFGDFGQKLSGETDGIESETVSVLLDQKARPFVATRTGLDEIEHWLLGQKAML